MAKINENTIMQVSRKQWFQQIKRALEYTEFKKDGLNLEMDCSVEDELSGHCFKFFCKCDSEPIEWLIDEYQNHPNNGYVTHIDKEITEGNLPYKISAVLKQMPYKNAISEVMGSQIMGLLGVPTCVNFCINPEDTKERMVASVNFMDMNKQFSSCLSMSLTSMNGFQTIDDIYKCIETALKGYPCSQVERVKQQYSLMFLCRAFLIGDFDYGGNFGVLKDNHLNLISYDYECAFHVCDISRYEERDIDTVRYRYYGMYTDLINRLQDVRDVLQSGEIEVHDETHLKMLKVLYSNICTILNYHNSLSEDEKSKTYPMI